MERRDLYTDHNGRKRSVYWPQWKEEICILATMEGRDLYTGHNGRKSSVYWPQWKEEIFMLATMEGNTKMFHIYRRKKKRTGNLTLQNAYTVGMYCAMCQRKLGSVGHSKVLRQMHVAQLLMALCAPNVH